MYTLFLTIRSTRPDGQHEELTKRVEVPCVPYPNMLVRWIANGRPQKYRLETVSFDADSGHFVATPGLNSTCLTQQWSCQRDYETGGDVLRSMGFEPAAAHEPAAA